jgi:hypothetical protein
MENELELQNVELQELSIFEAAEMSLGSENTFF